MSETNAVTTELAAQYGAQVASDLERNLKEQDRVREEIEALQAQLAALQHDHTILVNVRNALGLPSAPPQPEPEEGTVVPAPRKKASAPASRSGRQRRTDKSAGKSAAPAGRQVGKRSTTASSAGPRAVPTLVDLVREYLSGLSEPRSAAEISTELEQRHPDREIKTKIVRLTLEGLVAKNQAQRTKQGRSVFYTTPDATEPAPKGVAEAEQPA
ncbi:hypothetical protein [Streptomyces gilvus]|uniref:hypothetical protein n=1 Tax=Streptomyces gilvus TaxID=2920937 RepID=UPI001F1102AC|nr:hypothetical protein [Streptomyces sp. CME 23]MCH5676569.1 hypothetical protein [Streptomyces sp. CME 23]